MGNNVWRKILSYKIKQHWQLLLTITLSTALIVGFMPRGEYSKFKYTIGKPWTYRTLTAPYDFIIQKPVAQMERELDSVRSHFTPYAKRSESTAELALSRLERDYVVGPPRLLPFAWRGHIERLISHTYSAGIIDSKVYKQLEQKGTREINIQTGQYSTRTSIANTYTPQSAYFYVLNQDTAHYPSTQLKGYGLSAYIQPNLQYDSVRSQQALEDAMQSVSANLGMVSAGQKIISSGEIVSANAAHIINSYNYENNKNNDGVGITLVEIMGQVIFVLMVLAGLILYLHTYRSDYFKRWKDVLLIFLFITGFVLATYIIERNDFFNIYIIPYAILPIILHVTLDSRTAFMTHLTMICISSMPLDNPYIFIIIQVLVGIVAAFSLRNITSRSQIYIVAGIVVASYIFIYAAFAFTHIEYDILDWKTYLFFIINGILLLFAYPLLFFIEKVFGYMSNIMLIELSNTNNRLLQQLSENAPGTFQHTIQVSNLAAAAAEDIENANVQLVRVGALYHDIGKMSNPQFFTENQNGMLSPMDYLSYEQASQIVISHVAEGERLAKQHHLPADITAFIRTHHGNGVAKYFLASWQNEHPNQQPDLSQFTYTGDNPYTTEQAILMMADAVEATSHSLKEITQTSLSEMVDKIIDGQMQAGCLNDAPISLKDINTTKRAFKECLGNIYHSRITYPETKQSSSLTSFA